MTSDWLGGGIVLLLAAGLWMIYFMPTWFRRREYIATEMNAVRLQQTLRILAETTELPEEIRVETTARGVAEQQRYLKQREREKTPEVVLLAARIRRSRAVTSIILVASIVVAILASFQLALAGAAIVVGIGATVSVTCVIVLSTLARAGRKLKLPAPEKRVAPAFVDHTITEEITVIAPVALEETSSWTPVPLPKPLYQARPVSAGLAASQASVVREVVLERTADAKRAEQDAHNALRAQVLAQLAAAESTSAEPVELHPRRVAAERSEVAAPAVAEASAPTSRFASMGIVDDVSASINLDEVLARRRAG